MSDGKVREISTCLSDKVAREIYLSVLYLLLLLSKLNESDP